MRVFLITMLCLIISACCQNNVEFEDSSKPIVIYKERTTKTLEDIACDLLEFGKYEMALELVKDDTTAVGVKMDANYALGKIHDAIDYGVLNLRDHDTSEFFEASWVLVNMYEIFMDSPEYSIDKLKEDLHRCHSNFQVRLLLMKILWTQDKYEEVIKMGDEFRIELPDMSDEVCFNYWRQDALDSLFVMDRPRYDKLMESYNRWNGVECIY